MNTSIADLRQIYSLQTLSENDVLSDPIPFFARWFEEALKAKISEPNAMTVATASRTGVPSARIVLLKGFDSRGFVFFTQFESQKGKNLTENPHASLLFWWEALERQVRIEGKVERIAAVEADAYFASRPRDSQLGAWASTQSEEVASRDSLETAWNTASERFDGKQVPRPPFWGGYRVIPERFEFWQGRPSRLHDRISYSKTPDEHWRMARLAP